MLQTTVSVPRRITATNVPPRGTMTYTLVKERQMLAVISNLKSYLPRSEFCSIVKVYLLVFLPFVILRGIYHMLR
jgi:hypothetical protein